MNEKQKHFEMRLVAEIVGDGDDDGDAIPSIRRVKNVSAGPFHSHSVELEDAVEVVELQAVMDVLVLLIMPR
eukprot:1547433-Ditylum_brightwellii.AAC.1